MTTVKQSRKEKTVKLRVSCCIPPEINGNHTGVHVQTASKFMRKGMRLIVLGMGALAQERGPVGRAVMHHYMLKPLPGLHDE